MNKVLVAFVGLVILLGSCTQRMICPAYQSAFIYDKEVLRKKFSYFENDSIPRVFTASTRKNQYLVAVPETYRKKLRSLQTVEMKPIYPQIPDSLKEEKDFSLAEREVTAEDSAALLQAEKGLDPTDSAYAITKKKEKYNVDQDNYMWYFKDVLVLPDVRAAMEQRKEAEEEAEGKGLFDGLKNLFKKKKRDSTDVDSPLLDDSEEVETDENDSTTTPKIAPVKQKKGLLNRKSKDKTAKKEPPKKDNKKKDPAKKEDEDDGF